MTTSPTNGIGQARPADKASSQSTFSLQSADTDGVATEKTVQRLPRTLSGADLAGALMSAGEIAGADARNITLALSSTTAGFTAGSEIIAKGIHPHYDAPVTERFVVGSANGNETHTGSKMFRASAPIEIQLPAGGAWTHGTVPAPWNFAPADQLDIELDTVADSATFDAAAAIVTATNAETYDLVNGQTLSVFINELDPVHVVFLASRAWDIRSVVGPTFNLEPADTFEYTLDGTPTVVTFDAAAGVITSGNTEPFDLAHNDTLVYNVDVSVADTTVTVTAVKATAVVSANSEPFNMGSGEKVLLVNVDGVEQTVDFDAGDFVDPAAATAEEIVTAINADLIGSPATGTVAVTLSSAITGNTSRVQVIGGNANTVLGFPTTNSVGSGNVGNVDVATAQELADIVNAATPGVAADDAGALVLSSLVRGTAGSIEAVSGNVATVTDLAVSVETGTGDVANIDAVTLVEARDRINADSVGSPASIVNGYVLLTSGIVGSDSELHVTGGNANDAFGFPTADYVGTGNVANIDAVSADECVTLLNAVLVGAVADKNVNKPRITTTRKGTSARVQVSGPANTAIAFAVDTSGTGDVADIDAVTAAEFKRVVEADCAGCSVVINDDDTVSVGHATDTVAKKIQVMSTSEVETIVGLNTSVHAVGGVTVGAGVARALVPPARWLWVNETGNLYLSLSGDDDGVITKFIVDTLGPQPLSAEALHASTTIDDLVPIV